MNMENSAPPLPAPEVSRRSRFSLIWIVPLVALAVGGWMLFGNLRHRGPEIRVDFAEAAGIKADQTEVEYKGVRVGQVTRVELKPDLSGVTAHIRLEREAEALAAEGGKFWVVQPEVGLSGVRGLDTILKGVRINLRPGKGSPTDRFVGLDREPPVADDAAGRHFLLETPQRGSITPNSPVYYRDVKIGQVETTWLARDASHVMVRVRILEPYVALVRNNSRFWNAGGFSLKISLLGGAEVRNNSLESILNGAIALATPDGPLAPQAAEGELFPLHPEADKEWLKWAPKIPVEAVEAPPLAPARVPMPE